MTVQYAELAYWNIHNSIGIITLKKYSEYKGLGGQEGKNPKRFNQHLLKAWISKPDLKGLILIHQRDADNESDGEQEREILDCILHSPVPSIGTLTGKCSAFTVRRALACHIRVCSNSATLIMPPMDSHWIQVRPQFSELQGGMDGQKSAEFGNSVQTLTASEAYNVGAVDHLVPESEVVPFSLSLLDSLTADRPIHVIHAITQSLNNARLLSPEVALHEEGKLFCQLALLRIAEDVPRNSI